MHKLRSISSLAVIILLLCSCGQTKRSADITADSLFQIADTLFDRIDQYPEEVTIKYAQGLDVRY